MTRAEGGEHLVTKGSPEQAVPTSICLPSEAKTTNNGDLVKHEPGYLHAGVAC